jgi:hypothetical protein
MATIQDIIAKFIAEGTISPAYGVRVSEQYERLLKRNGNTKAARLQLAEWLEREARYHGRPGEQSFTVGFRLARTLYHQYKGSR